MKRSKIRHQKLRNHAHRNYLGTTNGYVSSGIAFAIELRGG